MEKMTRNEFLITTMKEIAEEKNVENVKMYLNSIDIADNEKNSLYAKCVMVLKELDQNNKNFLKNYIETCDSYLNLAKGKYFNKVKYDNELRKKNTKQLNIDIDKEIMKEFEECLKKNNQTKKSVILKAIEDYIEKSKKDSWLYTI